MRTPEPKTQTVNSSELNNTLSSLIDAVARQETRVVVEKNGTPVAVLVSAEDLERLSRFEREREERFSVIDRMREAFADVSSEEIEREAERTVAEARERIRQRNAEPAARSA